MGCSNLTNEHFLDDQTASTLLPPDMTYDYMRRPTLLKPKLPLSHSLYVYFFLQAFLSLLSPLLVVAESGFQVVLRKKTTLFSVPSSSSSSSLSLSPYFNLIYFFNYLNIFSKVKGGEVNQV
eukprot:TRINITY_DN39587_c0_g1_i1.p1 TRINITY_DN39587_c0_g1~~TRINITY_DN39587_c0_g1_i1.p1  ORF type:complete len:122 (+),score=15.50 TRINITY_DN39587_c0_g1_i1:883-1248(+)